MKIPRIMIAAASSSSGKTMAVCGILQILKNRGLRPAAFKCGPDYIDPMFHEKVLGTPSKNLDSFFLDGETLRRLMVDGAKNADISIIEGVMGYYDGAGADTDVGSSYDIARITKTPAVLVVNARGMSRSAAALIKGFIEYRKESRIEGVILNQITEAAFDMLRPVIEGELGIKAIGYIPRIDGGIFKSRHLGLVAPDEAPGVQADIEKISGILEDTLDVELLIKIANGASRLDEAPLEIPHMPEADGVRIAVAKDEAFCFYYHDNLELLKKLGANIVYFSPMRDGSLPKNVHGCILGGGYPELHLDELSGNEEMIFSIRGALARDGLPYMAECGGFLYLHDEVEDMEHKRHRLAGIVDARAEYKGRLQRFGYMELFGKKGILVKAHEFHYYASSDAGSDFTAKKPFGGKVWKCMHETDSAIFGFPHIYYYSNIDFAREFVKKCAAYMKKVRVRSL